MKFLSNLPSQGRLNHADPLIKGQEWHYEFRIHVIRNIRDKVDGCILSREEAFCIGAAAAEIPF